MATVKALSTITHDGTVYEAGSEIILTDSQAVALVAANVAEQVTDEPAKTPPKKKAK